MPIVPAAPPATKIMERIAHISHQRGALQRCMAAAGCRLLPKRALACNRSHSVGKPKRRAWFRAARVAAGPNSCEGLPSAPVEGVMAPKHCPSKLRHLRQRVLQRGAFPLIRARRLPPPWSRAAPSHPPPGSRCRRPHGGVDNTTAARSLARAATIVGPVESTELPISLTRATSSWNARPRRDAAIIASVAHHFQRAGAGWHSVLACAPPQGAAAMA